MSGRTGNERSGRDMYINGRTEENRMNRNDKRRMTRVIQNYDRTMRTAYAEFEREMDDMKDEESRKQDNLPSSFETSPVAENLSTSFEMLETALGKAEDIIDTLDEILDDTGVSSDYTCVTRTTKVIPEKKDVSFHALISSSLLKRLKEESQRTGLSMNEIVCQALLKELKD